MNLHLTLLVLEWMVQGPRLGAGVPAAVRPGLDVEPGLVSVIGDRLGGGAEGDAARGPLGEAGTTGKDYPRVTTAARVVTACCKIGESAAICLSLRCDLLFGTSGHLQEFDSSWLDE